MGIYSVLGEQKRGKLEYFQRNSPRRRSKALAPTPPVGSQAEKRRVLRSRQREMSRTETGDRQVVSWGGRRKLGWQRMTPGLLPEGTNISER